MTINEARKLLGKTSTEFTDTDIEYLLNQFYEIADIVTGIVGSKQTTKGIESVVRKVDYGDN